MNPTYAQERIVTGHGYNSCGAWAEARNKGKLVSMPFEAWVQGYLSGINGLDYFKTDILKDSDYKSWFVWIDNYCQQNPLEKISMAALQLAGELYNRQNK